MYNTNHPALGYIGLGSILGASDQLYGGQTYTLTFDSGSTFDLTLDSTVLLQLQDTMKPFGSVVSCDRPFFSSRYVVVFTPSATIPLSKAQIYFGTAFSYAGFSSASLIQAEQGSISSVPGGVSQALSNVTSSVGQGVENIVAPVISSLSPVLVVAAIIGAAYLFKQVKDVRSVGQGVGSNRNTRRKAE